jgi:autotransporter translocation and assembly factor TamB
MLRIFKKVLIAISILLLLGMLVLALPPVQRSMKNYLFHKINAGPESMIHIGKINGLFSKQVTLENVEIKTDNFRLACRKIRLTYHPYLLLWGYLNIEELETDSLKVKIIKPLGKPPAPLPSKRVLINKPQEPYWKYFEIKRIVVGDSEIQVSQGDKTLWEMDNINLVAGIYYDIGKKQVKFSVNQLGFSSAAPAFTVMKAGGEITASPSDVRFSNLKIQLPKSTLYLDGYIRDFQNPQTYFKLKANPLVLTDILENNKNAGKFKPLRVDLSAAGRISRLNCSLGLNYGKARTSWHGLVDLTGQRQHSFSLQGDIQHLNLAELNIPAFGETDINLRVEAQGKGDEGWHPDGNAVIMFKDSFFGPFQVFPSQLTLEYEDKILTLASNLVNTDFGHFTFKGQALLDHPDQGLPSADLELSFDQFNLKSLLHKVYLGTNLNGKLRLTVKDLAWERWRESYADLQLSLLPSNVARVRITNLSLRASLGQQKLKISQALLESGLLATDIKGEIDFNGNTDLHFFLESKDLNLGENIFPDLKLAGTMSLEGQVTGRTSDPIINFYINGGKLKYNRYILSRLDLHGAYEGKKLDYEVSATANSDQNLELRGTTDLNQKPAHTVVDLLMIQYLDQTWTNAKTFMIDVGPKYLSVRDFVIGNHGQLVRANGTLDINGALGFNLSLENIQLDAFNQSIAAEKKIDGNLNCFMAITGTAAAPRIKSRVEIGDLQVKPVCFTKYIMELDLEQGWWTLQGQATCTATETLDLDGKLYYPIQFDRPWPDIWQSRLDLKAKVDRLPLDFLQNMTASIAQSQGSVNALIEAHGVLSAPDISIVASTNDCFLKLVEISEPFTSLKVKAVLSGNKLALDYLLAETGQGAIKVSGTGQVTKINLDNFNFALKITNGPLYYPGIFHATVNGEGNFRKNGDTYSLEAQVQALEGLIEIRRTDKERKSDIVYLDEAGSARLPGSSQPPESFYDRLTMDIKIHSDGNLWYKQDTSKAEIEGDLRLLKERKKPLTYLGSIKTKQGYYDFLRNRFIITKGELQFPGTAGFNPLLNIDGEYTELSELKITATVRGDLNNPIIQLNSEPPQKDVEILSYLLFGKSSQNLTPQETSSVETQVLSFIGRSTVLKVRDILGDKLTIDTLDIKRDEKTQDWRVSVGKYLGRKLFVSYTFGFSPEAEDKLRLEYKLGRRWNVESEISQKHSAGADLFWTIDY